jgi:hypothetical protein
VLAMLSSGFASSPKEVRVFARGDHAKLIEPEGLSGVARGRCNDLARRQTGFDHALHLDVRAPSEIGRGRLMLK